MKCVLVTILGCCLLFPASAVAGPLREAAKRVTTETQLSRPFVNNPYKTAGVYLIAGGAAMVTLGLLMGSEDPSDPEKAIRTNDIAGLSAVI